MYPPRQQQCLRQEGTALQKSTPSFRLARLFAALSGEMANKLLDFIIILAVISLLALAEFVGFTVGDGE